jgi:hypothetical protein
MKTIKFTYNLFTAIIFGVLFLGACPDLLDTNSNNNVTQIGNEGIHYQLSLLDSSDSSQQESSSHLGFHLVEIDSFVPQTFIALGVPLHRKIELNNFHVFYIQSICLNVNPLPPSLV